MRFGVPARRGRLYAVLIFTVSDSTGKLRYRKIARMDMDDPGNVMLLVGFFVAVLIFVFVCSG